MKRIIPVFLILCFSFPKIYGQNVGVGNTSPNSKLDVSGDLALREGTAITVASGNNIITLPSAKNSVYRLTGATGAFSVNAVSAGNDGMTLTLINATGQVMTVRDSASIRTNVGANLVGTATVSSVTMIYNATLGKWIVTGGEGFSNSSEWSLTGNAGTTSSNFIGTTDNNPLYFKTNGSVVGYIPSSANITGNTGFGVGNGTPGGSYNVFMGFHSLSAGNTGNDNVTMGWNTLDVNTTGSDNIGLGWQPLAYNTTGSSNVALGSGVLEFNKTGSNNIGAGPGSLGNDTTGGSNVAIGDNALHGLYNGSNNTVLGNGAGSSATGSANVFLGNNAGANELTSNKLYIANSNTATPLLYGDFTNQHLTVNDSLTTTYFQMKNGAAFGDVLLSDANGNGIWTSAATVLAAFGHGTQNYITKFNNLTGTTIGNSQIYDNGTDVGIATATPQNKLDVNGSVAVGSYAGTNAAPSNGLIVSGNVGVGTTSPAYPLDVNGQVRAAANAGGSGAAYVASTPGANVANAWDVTSGTTDQKWWDFIAYSTVFGGRAVNDANTLNNYWILVNRGSGYNISSVTFPNGNVGIGTSSPAQLLDVNGTSKTINFQMTSGATAGYILQSDASGNASWVSPSSIAATNIYNSNGSLTGARTVTIGSSNLSFVSSGAYILLDPTASGRTGIGTASPISLFANTPTNILGSDGHGVVNNSLTWSVSAGGYAAAIYNGDNSASSNGLAVQTAGTTSNTRILDLSTAASQGTTGTTVMAVLGTGNVGIGTGSPQQMLSVNAGMNIDQAGGNTGTVSTNALTFGNGSGEGIASNRNSGANVNGLDFYTDYTNRLAITNGGNVGIGTTTPGSALTVNGTTSTTNFQMTNGANSSYLLQSDASGNGTWVNPSSISANNIYNSDGTLTGNRTVTMGNDNLYFTTTGGKVGIGNTSPGATVDVSGNMSVGSSNTNSGTYTFIAGNNNTISSGQAAVVFGSYNNASADHVAMYGDHNVASGLNSVVTGYLDTVSGYHSIAMGDNNNVSGDFSMATGTNNKISTGGIDFASGANNNITGSNSAAFGNGNTVSGGQELVAGSGNTAAGSSSLVTGSNNSQASGSGALIAGSVNTASADHVAIFGDHNIASANNDVVAGYLDTVSGAYSIAMGLNNHVSGGQSAAFGSSNTAVGNNALASGTNNNAPSFSELTLGMNATTYTASSASSYSATDRIFDIGDGTSSSSRSDAMTILKNGNVGIGNNSPTKTLQVNGTTSTTNFQMTNGGTANYILQSDASGNGTWVSPSSITANNIYNSNGTLTGNRTVTMGGDSLKLNGGTVATNQDMSINGMTVGEGAASISTNTTLGFAGLASVTTGAFNLATGWEALPSNTTGGSNTAVGGEALRNNTSGKLNTAVGESAIYSGNGTENTAIGANALYTISGNQNTGLGANTGYAGVSNKDIFIGDSATAYSPTHAAINNAVAIGANAEVTASNSIILGSISGTNGATSGVNVGIGTTAPTSTLQVVGTTSTTNFQMTNGGTANYLLQSDASGNGTWVAPSSIAANNIYNANGTLTGARTVTQGADNLTFSSTTGNFVYTTNNVTGGGVALGYNNTISSTNNVAIGSGNTASAAYSSAIGFGNAASGQYSMAMGSNSTASGKGAFTNGYGLTAASYYETALGTSNTTYTPASTTTWSATDRLFGIGNGSSPGSPSDAFVILKNGNTGVGTASPSSTLQVNGKTSTTNFQMTSGGTANYLLVSDASGNGTWTNPSTIATENIYNTNGTLTGARTVTMSGNTLNFTGGDVGIGTASTNATFNVNGNAVIGGGLINRAGSGLTVDYSSSTAYAANTDPTDAARGLSIVNEGTTTNEMAILAMRVNPNGGANNQMMDMKLVNPNSGTSNLIFSFGPNASFTDRFTMTSAGYLGVGTTSPESQLANTGTNIIGQDGQGVNTNSLTWAMSGQTGYVGAFYNANSGASGNGLAVKVAGTASTDRILDLSTGAQTTAGTSVMVALGNGNVGIGTSSPVQTLTTQYASGLWSGIETANHGFATQTGTSTSDYILYEGADKTNALSYIQSVRYGTAVASLGLNERGGSVGIGTGLSGTYYPPTNTLSVNGSGGFWNNNLLNFYTDAGSNQKGQIGMAGNTDFQLAATVSGTWMRIGANNSSISFFPDGTINSAANPMVKINPQSSNSGSVASGTYAVLEVWGVAGSPISNSATGNNQAHTQYGWLATSGNGTSSVNGRAYSLYTWGSIWCNGEVDATSDERIKDVLDTSDNARDLSAINKLNVVDYKYIDKQSHGDTKVKGFLAQQVETVFPDAVKTQPGVIPNIYRNADDVHYDAASKKLTVTMGADHGLVVGDKVQIKAEGEDKNVRVSEIVDSKTFVVEDWEKDSHQVFVFGKEVPDLRNIDYNKIFSAGISAIQELSKKTEQLECENESLKAQNAALQSENSSVRSDMSKLKNSDTENAALIKTMKAQIDAISERLNMTSVK